jgi:site-specific DNA recombinase
MSMNRLKALKPRDGHTLQAGIIARISGCQNQKEISLEDQVDHAKEEVARLYDEGQVEYVTIATKGKGERLDRPELGEIAALLRSRRLDLLVLEDIGRLIRGADAVRLFGIAVDHGVRVIAPNDCIDTAEDSWEEDVIAACRDHVGHNAHTSKRLKHKLMNRFKRHGGAPARPTFGYEVPEGAKTYGDWLKADDATPILVELFQRLRGGSNFSEAARWFNAKGVSIGKYHRNKKWDCRMVARLVRNPILKGTPYRGGRHTVKHHETGRRISVKNPAGPTFIDCPHLAHVPAELFDEVNAILVIRNRGLGRKTVNGADPRAGVSRKYTCFPGQHARCGVCRRLFYWGGHGQAEHMMCSGSRDYNCWNAATFDGREAARRVADEVLTQALPEFDAAFLEQVNAEAEAARLSRAAGLSEANRELAEVDRKLENVRKAAADGMFSEMLKETATQLWGERARLAARIHRLKQQPQMEVVLPPADELRMRATEVMRNFVADSPESRDVMRRLVPKLVVIPHRLCDGGQVVHRALLVLDIGALLDECVDPAGPGGTLRREVTIDLFEPPQRVKHRQAILQKCGEGLTAAHAARELGITKTAAQNALRLDRRMREFGLTDPYVRLTAPPADGRLKRHLHEQFSFNPLPDAEAA